MDGLIDLHVDSIILQRLFGYDIETRHRRGIGGQPLFWHADIPRMVEAGYGGAAMGVHYYPFEAQRGWHEMRCQIGYLDEVAEADERTMRIRSVDDWSAARSAGKLGLTVGVEGAHMLGGKIERARRLAELDVAYLTLTHFSANSAATPSIGRGANEREGLTAFGRRLVRELNDGGVAVDLAHVNTPGVLDACRVSRAPVLCTHTGVRGVYDDARNITDGEIDAIAATGGVIGIIQAPVFLTGRLRAPTEVVVDHYEYVIDRVGIDHVAIGSDYDGWIPTIPGDQRDCRDVTRVFDVLAKRGYSDEELRKLASANVLRVFREVQEIGDRAGGGRRREALDERAESRTKK